MIRFTLFPSALLALTGQLAAQQAPPAAGDRVRITLTASAAERVGTGRVDARLLAATGDSVALDTTLAGAPFAVGMDDVAKFERYAGRQSMAGKGALVGLGIGALAGGVTAFALSNAGGSCDGFVDFACEDTADTMGLAGAAAGGLLGMLLGAVAGAATSGDRWTPVGESVQVTPTVIRGVPGIAMRMEF
jgi:hypothetical protein